METLRALTPAAAASHATCVAEELATVRVNGCAGKLDYARVPVDSRRTSWIGSTSCIGAPMPPARMRSTMHRAAVRAIVV